MMVSILSPFVFPSIYILLVPPDFLLCCQLKSRQESFVKYSFSFIQSLASFAKLSELFLLLFPFFLALFLTSCASSCILSLSSFVSALNHASVSSLIFLWSSGDSWLSSSSPSLPPQCPVGSIYYILYRVIVNIGIQVQV